MEKMKQYYLSSLKEFTVTTSLAFCAMMAALALILNYVATIMLGPFIKITFSEMPNRMVEFALGPVVGAIFGGLLDIFKYITNPVGGNFFLGFTLNAIISGIIYGTILYRHKFSIRRIVIAKLIVSIVVDLGMTTLWLSMMYGNAYFVLLQARLLKVLIMFPIDCIILSLMFGAMSVGLARIRRDSANAL